MKAMRPSGIIIALSAIGALALAGGGASPVRAQQPASALKGHDADAPVEVTADRIEVQDRADRAIFSGTVHVKQAELTLDADRVTVAYSSTGGLQIDRIDAAGGVLVRSPSETARGAFATYDTNRKLITVIGNVELNRGQNRVLGQRLVIDLSTGRAVIDGGPPGVNQSGGRVTGRFTVPQRTRR